ncbi:MAG: hypothetical protein CL843_09135 [Crocinitomicaceae bacterium]|nr:hypothetical protein [Crocinitomicaceae bacterium]|tara:strand:+ start:3222 stop:3905 length:684 start_codon:yes stop_codon:yes gene_type:complete
MTKNKLILSPSKIERFRQYMDGEFSDYVTNDMVIETIKGEQKLTPKMTFGSAFHAILENGSDPYNWEKDHLVIVGDDLQSVVKIPKKVVDVALKYRDDHPNMVFEVKLKTWLEIGNHNVLLNGRMDGVEGLVLHEQKTSSKPPNVDFYSRSMQWRSYFLMSEGSNELIYNLFNYDETDHLGVPFEIKHMSFKLFPYPEMKDHLVRTISELISFCEYHKITDFIKSKY